MSPWGLRQAGPSVPRPAETRVDPEDGVARRGVPWCVIMGISCGYHGDGPVATVRAHKAITPKCSSRSCFAFAGSCDWCQVAITFFQVLEPCV